VVEEVPLKMKVKNYGREALPRNLLRKLILLPGNEKARG
jgi:hypothetical protein